MYSCWLIIRAMIKYIENILFVVHILGNVNVQSILSCDTTVVKKEIEPSNT